MKLLIIGHPRCGKTTLAQKMASEHQGPPVDVIHTDDLLKQYEWSAFSDKVCDLLKQDGDWIIEGCSAVRGLRKYLRDRQVRGDVSEELPFTVVWLDRPYVPLAGRQIGFGASLKSIWAECQEILKQQKETGHDSK